MKSELAATTKLLKAVSSLRFANRRSYAIEPEVEPDWLARSKLTPTARRQLAALLGLAVDAPVEQTIEWFDVFDQADVVQFQLWLLRADKSGVLFKAATTVSVAIVAAGSFAGAGSGLDQATAERLAALLRAAKKIAAKLHPGSGLAELGF